MKRTNLRCKNCGINIGFIDGINIVDSSNDDIMIDTFYPGQDYYIFCDDICRHTFFEEQNNGEED